MRGDFSRFIAHDSFNQYIGTFMQQGRVQIDADWNENVVNFLNMLWKQSRDFLGTSACVGDSFRIGKDIPIDHMLQGSVWNLGDPSDNYSPPDKRGYIFLNTNDRPHTNMHSANEKASLFVENANAIFREFNNLDLSRFRSIYVRFKVIGGPFQIAICPKCSRVYAKGEQQYCNHCGTRLEEEEKEEEVEDGEYTDKNDNNYNSSSSSNNNQSSQSIPVLTLSVYTDKEENSSNNNENKYEYEGHFIGPPDAGGFFKVKFDLLRPHAPTKTSLDKYDVSRISKLSLHWDKTDDRAVCIGLISAEPMAVIVSADIDRSKSNPWANVTNSSSATTNNNSTSRQSSSSNSNNSISIAYEGKPSISITYKGKPTIMKERGRNEMKWSFSRPMNFNSIKILRFATSTRNNDNSTSRDDTFLYSNPMLFLVKSNKDTMEFSLTEEKELSNDSWRSYSANIEDSKDESKDTKKVSATDDLNEIQSIGLKGLPENDVLHISEISGELNFENNFLISGDFDLDQSSRMYVNGILCSRDNWDSYLTQKDIPSANGEDYFIVSSEDAESQRNQHRNIKKAISYIVYADVWNRGITHLEDPKIREVALGGSDTSTRMQTICQIKLREIPDHLNFQHKIGLAEYEIKKMNEEGAGRLSVIYPHNSSLSNSESNFRTLGNHLYRIQIHDSEEGRMNNNDDDNNRATFKWSKDNASKAFPIKGWEEKEVKEVELDQKGRRLDNAFRIGDLIEIIDDIDELSEQPRGHMRRITKIEDGGKRLSWGTREDSEQISVKYLHEPVTITAGRYRPDLHPKVILWDGIDYVNATMDNSSSYSLMSTDRFSSSDEGIRIRFDPGVFRSGHYWNFTTRSNGSVELLKSAKPMGPKHHYALLALIRKEIGKEIEIIEDLRHTYQPLTNLRAIDISYDDGGKLRSGAATNVQAAIQRLSGGRLRILSGHGNNGTINDLAIDAGEIYELKPVDGKQGTFASRIPFNDIYQHQPFLIYTIRSGNNSSSSDVRHEIHMLAADEDGNMFKDPVDDGTKNYAWKGFEIEADENAQVSWLAIGDSYTYFERFVKRVLDEILRVIFGVDTDELKEDNSILDAWYKKYLRNLSDSGSDLERQAREHIHTLQNDFDRRVRKFVKQMRNFQEDVEEVFDFDEEKKEEQEARDPPKSFAQMINCPNCGQSYPKGKYTFCTKCSAKLPIE
jgi:Family of unknown function (DUF6519)